MISLKQTAVALALATSTALASAATGTTFTAAWGIGEVRINDPRILDLSGEYDLVGTTHSLHLRIVQDLRGHLITTATVTQIADNVTTTFPMLGGIGANGKAPLGLQLAGSRRPPPAPFGSAFNLPPSGPPRDVPAATIRGRLFGDHFHVFVEVRGLHGGSRFEADLTPQNTARGGVIADSPAVSGPNGGLITTRTITLPASVHHLRGVEARRGISDRLNIGAPPPPRQPSINPPPPFGMDLLGAINDQQQFLRRKNIVRIGYGNLDSTSGTVVSRTNF